MSLSCVTQPPQTKHKSCTPWGEVGRNARALTARMMTVRSNMAQFSHHTAVTQHMQTFVEEPKTRLQNDSICFSTANRYKPCTTKPELSPLTPYPTTINPH